MAPSIFAVEDPSEDAKDGAEKSADDAHYDSKYTSDQSEQTSDHWTDHAKYASDNADGQRKQQYTNTDNDNGRDGFRIHGSVQLVPVSSPPK